VGVGLALHPLGEGQRVGVVVVGDLPPLPGVDADVLVAARVRGAAEADLVPRPRVGVERGGRVAGPQTPDVVRRPTVELSAPGGAVEDVLDHRGRGRRGELGEPPPVSGAGVGVEVGEGVPPRLAVLGHVLVAPPVGLAGGQAGVDEGHHRDPGLAVLGQQQIAEQRDGGILGRGEERQVTDGSEAGQDDTRRHVVPAVGLGEHVVPGETTPALRGDCPLAGRTERHQVSPSRRSTAASRPMPPTRLASSGANTGGPISRL